jgi:predicted DNA binding CopG/RHH family protein
MEKPMRLKKIPQTDSIRELAHFWDIHDLTDFEDELEEVTESVFQRETLVRICLPKNEFETIKEIAKSRGVEHTELIRQWVSEKVEAS